jgi:hypothetical protein
MAFAEDCVELDIELTPTVGPDTCGLRWVEFSADRADPHRRDTNFTYRDNTSNDPYHDFDDNTFTLGVSLKF